MKRIDFPIKPHLLKYLQVHLKLATVAEFPVFKAEDYLLSKSNRFGFALNQLLRKPAKSARHEGSLEGCTARLGVDLRNFNAAYYDLLQGKLSAYVVFQFNDFVDDIFKAELYWWVAQHVERRSTIKDAIRSFMVFYDVSEDDLAYETLKKSVQRNGGLRLRKKKKAKSENFPVNLSPKTGELSPKKRKTSPKTGVLSQKDVFAAVRQSLMALPLPISELDFLHAGR
ncbi:hypothetical protein [Hymenobacter nivis]|uniref:Uncharacterized protein n=1 Tax=Hymenobacter nivis TaxID=1850093 RepID=A0A502HFS3_9BACT|nr:hypothetical protein [Hymenobacter nivis]TPG72000.1 hypothetical protein EAH73_01780 [Hymenobacter nivis]